MITMQQILICLSLFCFVCSASTTAESSSPNLLILFTDDLGYADIGAYSCTDIPTPHLATEFPEKVKELSDAFFGWQKQMPKPLAATDAKQAKAKESK